MYGKYNGYNTCLSTSVASHVILDDIGPRQSKIVFIVGIEVKRASYWIAAKRELS